jgi:hypothetical protein
MTGTGIDRRLLVLAGLVLVLAALLGYVAGRGHASSAPREATFTASVHGVLLDVPPHWRAAATTHEIPGLVVRNAIALGPGGDSSQAGLLAGALPAGQGSPLPGQLLARLRQQPTTAVVSLQEAQAYRYSGLSIAGFDKGLTVYVVPSPGGDSTALACYAASAQSPEMQACERSVATLRLAGQSQTYDLTPKPEYAQGLSASISTLNAQRATLRGQMGSGTSPQGLQRVAARLARAFAEAAGSLSGLETTLATGQAQSALSGAILRARAAYAALAAAAGARSEAGFATGRTQVERAEAAVDRALLGFALLGYKAA